MDHLSALLSRYRSGWSLERDFYTDAGIFDKEWQRIWRRQWLFAGTVAAIPKPGDYFVYQLGSDSVIVIRGNNAEVFAHHNTCRHRGSLICLEEKGHAPKLVCPYHQWVFDKNGKLLKARLMPEDFDTHSHGLHPVKVEVVEGFIFICLNDEAPDFEALRRDYTAFLRPYQVNQSRLAFSKRYTLRTNWKLVAENFRECYHCGPAHPEYCSAVVGANLREDISELLPIKQREWQQKGLATELVDFTPETTHFGIRYPLRPGVHSYSLDGKAVSIPMGQHPDHDAGVLGLVNYPNFWMDAVSDYMWTMRITPISASNTQIDLAWLVDEKAEQGKDFELEHLVAFWKVTGEQDWELCENNFSGIESSHYQPGPYAPVEDDVRRFVDWYIAEMKTT